MTTRSSPAMAKWTYWLTVQYLFTDVFADWSSVTLHLKLLTSCLKETRWSIFTESELFCLLLFLSFPQLRLEHAMSCSVSSLALLKDSPSSALTVCTELICLMHAFPTSVLYSEPPWPIAILTVLQGPP